MGALAPWGAGWVRGRGPDSMKPNPLKRLSLFDVFVLTLLGLAFASVYFTFVRPIPFSGRIIREGVVRYARLELLLPDDLAWLVEDLASGLEHRGVHGGVEWQILRTGYRDFSDRKIPYAEVKLRMVLEDSGLFRYGKYTLVRGAKVVLIGDDVFIEGRIYRCSLLDEKVPI